MSIKCLQYVFDNKTTNPAQRCVLFAIADRCDDEGVCYPGIERIASKANLSVRHTKRVLKQLEELGELNIAQQQGIETGAGKTNVYLMSNYRKLNNISDNRVYKIRPVTGFKEVRIHPAEELKKVRGDTGVTPQKNEKSESRGDTGVTPRGDTGVTQSISISISNTEGICLPATKKENFNPFMNIPPTKRNTDKKEKDAEMEQFVFEFLKTYKSNDPNTKRSTLNDKTFLFKVLENSKESHYSYWKKNKGYLDFIGQKIKIMADNNPKTNGLSLYKQVVPPMCNKWHIEWAISQEETIALNEAQINDCKSIIRDCLKEQKSYFDLIKIGWYPEGFKSVLERYFSINGEMYPEDQKNLILGLN